MIAGISFSNGVFFHNSRVIACAEVKNGVIHSWAEPITLGTIGKIWYRIVFTMPWYYHLLHLGMILYLLFPVWGEVNPLWGIVYLVGFHFVFPRRLKQFHGAEHKVFSHIGEKQPEAWEQVKQASIVNAGCSTNIVTYFFVFFLVAYGFLPLGWSVWAGGVGVGLGMLGAKYARSYLQPFHWLSGWLQTYLTTKEPERIHLETAIRSYMLFQYYQAKEKR